MIKIVYLYRELMAYNIPVLRSLMNSGCQIYFIHRDIGRKTPNAQWELEGVYFIKKSTVNNKGLRLMINSINPDLLFIADRTIPIYNKIGAAYRKRIPVVVGCDSQWKGGRQWLNVLTSFFRHRHYYSHILVAGMRQYEYARRLGFDHRKILWPLYSADTDKFKELPLNLERFEEARDFLFVGRLSKVKGIDTLLSAWRSVKNKNNVRLHIAGNGDYFKRKKVENDVLIHSFLTQTELVKLAKTSKAMVLPSNFEPWGVVVHEFAAAGLPIITTNVVGASSHLVINNYNGYLIKRSASELTNAMEKMLEHSSEQLLDMGKKSRELSNSISPNLVASALLSCLK